MNGGYYKGGGGLVDYKGSRWAGLPGILEGIIQGYQGAQQKSKEEALQQANLIQAIAEATGQYPAEAEQILTKPLMTQPTQWQSMIGGLAKTLGIGKKPIPTSMIPGLAFPEGLKTKEERLGEAELAKEEREKAWEKEKFGWETLSQKAEREAKEREAKLAGDTLPGLWDEGGVLVDYPVLKNVTMKELGPILREMIKSPVDYTLAPGTVRRSGKTGKVIAVGPPVGYTLGEGAIRVEGGKVVARGLPKKDKAATETLSKIKVDIFKKAQTLGGVKFLSEPEQMIMGWSSKELTPTSAAYLYKSISDYNIEEKQRRGDKYVPHELTYLLPHLNSLLKRGIPTFKVTEKGGKSGVTPVLPPLKGKTKTYKYYLQNEAGHKIGSNDQINWFDVKTGKRIQ